MKRIDLSIHAILAIKGISLNGHFHDPVIILAPDQIDKIFGISDDVYLIIVLPKFTGDEIAAYKKEKEMRAKTPVCDSIKSIEPKPVCEVNLD